MVSHVLWVIAIWVQALPAKKNIFYLSSLTCQVIICLVEIPSINHIVSLCMLLETMVSWPSSWVIRTMCYTPNRYGAMSLHSFNIEIGGKDMPKNMQICGQK